MSAVSERAADDRIRCRFTWLMDNNIHEPSRCLWDKGHEREGHLLENRWGGRSTVSPLEEGDDDFDAKEL